MSNQEDAERPVGAPHEAGSRPAQAGVSETIVRKVARLARLELREGEAPRYAAEMDAVLALVAHMESIPTDGVSPMAHPLGAVQRLRDDAVTEADQRELFQRAAPSVQDGMYLVPRVVE